MGEDPFPLKTSNLHVEHVLMCMCYKDKLSTHKRKPCVDVHVLPGIIFSHMVGYK